MTATGPRLTGLSPLAMDGRLWTVRSREHAMLGACGAHKQHAFS